MIDILIVDDDDNKVRVVRSGIGRAAGSHETQIHVAKNVARAWQILEDRHIDLLIVDLYVPIRDGTQASEDGGRRLLQRVVRRSAVNVPAHVVGLTAYGELRRTQEAEFTAEGWQIVEFSWESDSWEEPIGRKVLHIAEAAAGRTERQYRTDLAIITALEKVELEAVLALDAGWEVEKNDEDPTLYYRGTFRRDGIAVRAVAAAAAEMGMAGAAALTTKMIYRWRPRYIAMVGIAAGVKGEYGDILIAERAWDHGSGKVKGTKGKRRLRFQPAPSQVTIEPLLKAKLAAFSRNDERLAAIRKAWTGRAAPRKLSVRIGPIASGAAVVAAKKVIRALVAQHRKLVGVEMEIYGVLLAAQQASMPRPQACAIKSICDLGDERKSDAFQKYAAFTSARFLCEFALETMGVSGT